MNQFLKAVAKEDVFTENGAVSNSTTGSKLLDDYGIAGTYRGRSFDDVSISMVQIWDEDPLKALQLTFYLRNISRVVKMYGNPTEKVQAGQGAKDEFRKRMVWLLYNHPETFYANSPIIPLVGSYKDLWEIMALDYSMENKMDRKLIYGEMVHDLADDSTRELFLKYLPIGKAVSKLTTDRSKVMNKLAAEFRDYNNLSAREIRKLKSSGSGHVWQQLISIGKFKDIAWKTIPSRALLSLVKGKFLNNHELTDSYQAWLDTKPFVPFVGYPHELAHTFYKEQHKLSNAAKSTINKQFDGLLEVGRKSGGIKGNVWCALDVSPSMTWPESRIDGTDIYALEVCLALGIYFSSLNEGTFKDHIVAFSVNSTIHKLVGTFTEKWQQCIRINAGGSTNFQSVIDAIVRVRTSRPEIPLEDFPETILVVSDMAFNPSGVGRETNYQTAMNKLAAVGLPNVKIIWWNVAARTKDFPATMDDPGTYILSGFDGTIITSILGETDKVNTKGEKIPPTMLEAMNNSLSQEIFTYLKLS